MGLAAVRSEGVDSKHFRQSKVTDSGILASRGVLRNRFNHSTPLSSFAGE